MVIRGHITSKDNPRIAELRALQRGSHDDSNGLLVEGLRLVQSALQAGIPLASIYLSDSFMAGHPEVDTWLRPDIAAWSVTDQVFRMFSDTQTPQGIAAVVNLPEVSGETFFRADPLVLVDNIRDPGNLGTILRTAQATGMAGMLLPPGSVNPYSPKVVRSAMGAHFTLPIYRTTWQDIQAVIGNKQVFLADAHAGDYYWSLDWTAPLVLVVSSEAFGPSAEASQIATRRVRLPMAVEAESLNAAVAAGVLMYEIFKQRHLGSVGGSC